MKFPVVFNSKFDFIYFMLGSIQNETLRSTIAKTESDDIIRTILSQSIYEVEASVCGISIVGYREIENKIEFL